MEIINVGVLTKKEVKKLPVPCNSIRNVFESAKDYGVNIFTFTLDDVDIKTKTINAVFYNHKGRGYTRKVGYPHIVDDTAPGNNPAIVNDLKKYCVFVRNYHILSKLRKSAVIPEDGPFSDIVIPTPQLTSFSDIENALDKFDSKIVIKPSGGSLGRGVFKIVKTDDKYYVSNNKGEQIYDLAGLEEFYSETVGDTTYLIQPYRESVTSKNEPFDIRIFTKRGPEGKFMTSMYARTGEAGGIVATIREGRYIQEDVDVFLEREFGHQAKAIKERLQQIADEFPEYYQSFYEKPLFNVGLDIGITKVENSFRLSMYEVNIAYVGARQVGDNNEVASLGYYRHLYDNNQQKFLDSKSRNKIRIGYIRNAINPTRFFKLLHMVADANTLNRMEIFFFTEKSVDIETKTIKGLFWDKSKDAYVERETPYPDIVDNPLEFRNRAVHNDLKRYCFFLLDYLGGKSKAHSIISESEYSRYSIDTYRYRDIDVDDMLSKYNEIIIKPLNGSSGRSVYKLSKKDGLYSLRIDFEEEVLSVEEYKLRYGNTFADGAYIVQPYMRFVTSWDAPVDFRVNITRGKDGKWVYISTTPRIGHKDRITSNISAGGYRISDGWLTFLNSEYGDDAERINSEIEFIIKHLPDAVQSKYKTPIPILCFDVGVDRNNNNACKIIEYNTIPNMDTCLEYEFALTRIQYYQYLHEQIGGDSEISASFSRFAVRKSAFKNKTE